MKKMFWEEKKESKISDSGVTSWCHSAHIQIHTCKYTCTHTHAHAHAHTYLHIHMHPYPSYPLLLFPGHAIGIAEKVQPFPRQRLRDCLDHRLRQRGLVPSSVFFFVENSRTPLPDNCDANFLSGQRIVARGSFQCHI